MKINRFFLILILTLNIFVFGLGVKETLASTPTLQEMQESMTEQVDGLLDDINFKEIQNIVDNFDNNQTKIFSIGNIKNKIKQVIAGENIVDCNSFIGGFSAILVELISSYLPMFAVIVSVGVLGSILSSVKGKFNEKTIGDIVHFVCFGVVVVVLATIIKRLTENTLSSILSMQDQINVLFPIILTMMTAMGSVSSVAVFKPTMALFASLSSYVFPKIILPIFTATFCFSIIGNLSNNIKLDKFNSFFNSLFKWLLGILFTVFFALMSIQGISAGSFDSVSVKTMKFTMSSYVPVLGGYLSQGTDVLLASSILIKNAVGFVGILILLSSIIAPILEIVIVSLLLKIASAILQPLSNDRITNFLHSTSKCILMLSSCLIVVSMMYFLTIGLSMATANIL